jgi:nucleotide-binding universal stress UspA family protein
MKTILVPVDFSDCAVDVTEMAASIAKAFSARVILLHVAAPEPEFVGYKPGPQTVRDTVARELVSEHTLLHEMDHRLEAKGLSVTSLVIQGYPVEKILEEAIKFHADMIVMGSHGHGALRNLLVGSVTEGVMRRSSCPVLVVPHRA